MGKRKGHPSVEDVLARPWCYYCERDFDDLKILISHQKAKHFKCDRCGRRLNTAGGLSVHMNQVHKEQLASVENALPNRQGLEVEIFGMEGIPDDVVMTHNTRVMQQYYEDAAARRAKTGNPMSGSGEGHKRKQIKLETPDELTKRFQDWKRRKLDGDTTMGNTEAPLPLPVVDPAPPVIPASFGQPPPTAAPFAQPPFPGHNGFAPPGGAPFMPGFPPGQAPFSGAPMPFAGSLPGGAPGSGLPPRPGFAPPPMSGVQFPGAPGGTAAAVDDLIASVTSQGAKPATPTEKKGKGKDKTRMIYSDNEISPEEKMARLSRYAFTAA
ncbi:hypothetical protein BT63DRAFT_458727 [Microthyrium microscopicum]|uniref:C2H2-type domain-containing protein n=1 Tax=Microthyrium microscopicum TaxID=703497 RepID=A0A6A6U5Y9_9PEZI|nr:hypothetical protein BT63DRAFT_458727 [Microthyrium microscopicum]